MTSVRRVVSIVVVVVVLAVAAVVGAVLIRRQVVYGTVLDRSSTSATVEVGDRFTLKVRDRGPSVGDSWSATTEPGDVVTLVGDELISDSPIDRIFGANDGGGAGQHYFRFDAERAGQVTITLTNCVRGCQTERTRAASETLTWTVTVS
ncbi:protease inhibitor I42 family protein [Plantactinospora sp. B5E13]|uniref:protease inhibitor I42 family protein n=1 Tax=unclassified Plantactinospora TaxID=2631981 RepID=UPI00325D46D2